MKIKLIYIILVVLAIGVLVYCCHTQYLELKRMKETSDPGSKPGSDSSPAPTGDVAPVTTRPYQVGDLLPNGDLGIELR